MPAPERKPFVLRLDKDIFVALQRWADDDLRSLNGQIDFLLRRALKEVGRFPSLSKESPNKEAPTSNTSKD